MVWVAQYFYHVVASKGIISGRGEEKWAEKVFGGRNLNLEKKSVKCIGDSEPKCFTFFIGPIAKIHPRVKKDILVPQLATFYLEWNVTKKL
jgi:hypothetical protein